MSEDLAAAQKVEEDRKANHAGLIAAKEEEIATLTSTIETKLTQQGNLAVEVESLKNDVADTQRSLAADQELAAKLAGSCGSQSSEWEERRKSRAEDDALELFKATLPSPSLMQVHRSTAVLAKRALDDLRRSPTAAQNSASNLKLIALALGGKSVDFTKVISMIEEMVVLLKAEQGDDDSKKACCLENFDKTEDDAKALAKTIARHKDATQEFQEQLSNTDDRIAVVQKSLAELDDSVAKATEMRRKQHAEFVTLTANSAAATELLTLAAKQAEQIPRAPSCTRRRRRLSSVQTTACTSTWVARSPPLHPRASQARCRTGAVVAGRSRVRAFLLRAPEKSRGVQRRLVTHRVSGGGSGRGIALGQCGR